MFARRRTDQVFATLQQVQRRITEQQSKHPAVAVAPPGATAAASRTRSTLSPPPASGVAPSRSNTEAPPPSLPVLPPGVGAHQQYRIEVSGLLVSVLVVCWLASLVGAVLITVWVMRPAAALSVEPAPPVAAARTPAPAPSLRWKLIVASERATPEARQRFLAERAFLNQVAERNGWPPLFEVEEAMNGQLQLVFGRQGLDKAEWADFTAKLMRRHPGATWVELR